MIFNVESFADLNGENWEYVCRDKEKKNCLVGIQSINNNKIISVAYIQISTTSQKKLNLLDKEDETNKIGEEINNVPIIFINFPLNTDLRLKPIIRVGDKDISGLSFMHCNPKVGCNSSIAISNEVIELFKKGKEMSVFFRAFGSKKNLEIKFPLKKFTKSYKKLSKI